MIPNDVNITRLALRQSHTAADGLLLAAQTELKLANSQGKTDAQGLNSQQDVFDAFKNNADNARANRVSSPTNTSAGSTAGSDNAHSGSGSRHLVDKTA